MSVSLALTIASLRSRLIPAGNKMLLVAMGILLMGAEENRYAAVSPFCSKIGKSSSGGIPRAFDSLATISQEGRFILPDSMALTVD